MTIFTDSESETIAIGDAVTFQSFPGGILSDAVVFTDHVTLAYQAGAFIQDLVSFSELTSTSAIYQLAVTDPAAFVDLVVRTLRATLTDNVTFADVARVIRALFVADALGFADVVSFNGSIYGLSLLDTILANDVLALFWGGNFSDVVPFVDRVQPQWVFAGAASDAVAFADLFTPTLQIRMQLADTIDITDVEILKAIYNAVIDDSLCISIALIDPGGGFTAWAVNTRTAAVTEYGNFSFNSFAQFGNHYLGASSTGLFELDGTLDGAAAVVAQVKSGSAQFSGSRYTAIDAIYLGCRVSDSGNDWILKLHAGDGREYIYQFQPLNRRTTKIFVGKGLRARYFSWELITAGEDFDLDSIEFVPIGSKRRV